MKILKFTSNFILMLTASGYDGLETGEAQVGG